MELLFRHGLVRYQTDNSGIPTFIRKNGANPQFIDLVCDNSPIIFTVAHGQANYLVEIKKSKPNAWGPIPANGQTQYLYWDVSLLDARITFGYTSLPLIISNTSPISPIVNQHWFDKNSNQMKVWNGRKWSIKLRVFAGTYDHNVLLLPRSKGTQVGLNTRNNAGQIVMSSGGHPLFDTNGTFITTESTLLVGYTSSDTVKLEATLSRGEAIENIPAFNAVTFDSPGKIKVALPTTSALRIAGIIISALDTGEVGNIISSGPVVNDQWSFSDSDMNKAVYVNTFGEISLTQSPNRIGEIGYVYDTNAIFIDIKHQPIVSGSTFIPSVDAGTGIDKAISGSTVTLSLQDTAVTPGLYGSTVEIPSLTVDASGRITSAATYPIAIPPQVLINMTGDVSGQSDVNGLLNTTLNDTGVLAGEYKSVVVDTSGRVLSASNPTTLGGFGIEDAYTKTDVDTRISDIYTTISNKANVASTLSGYGITDAYTKSEVDTALNDKASIATTLAGYGITDAYTKAEIVTQIVVKADRSTTLFGYGITDTYTATEIDALLNLKANIGSGGGSVDLSSYSTTAEVAQMIGSLGDMLAPLNHTHVLADITDVVITTPVDNQVLSFVNGSWINVSLSPSGAPVALEDLSNVMINNPVDGSILRWSAEGGTWYSDLYPTYNGVTLLSVLSDVTLFTPNTGDVLTYDAITEKWLAAQPTAVVSNLASLSDVNVEPVDGDVLTYNTAAAKWMSVAPATGGTGGSSTLATLTDVSVTAPANGDVLRYNSSTSSWEAVNMPASIPTSVDISLFAPNAQIFGGGMQGQLAFTGYVSPRSSIIPMTNGGHIATSMVAPTTYDTILTIKKNGTSVIEITYNIGFTTGTIIFLNDADVLLDAGDLLTLHTPEWTYDPQNPNSGPTNIDQVIINMAVTLVAQTSF